MFSSSSLSKQLNANPVWVCLWTIPVGFFSIYSSGIEYLMILAFCEALINILLNFKLIEISIRAIETITKIFPKWKLGVENKLNKYETYLAKTW